MRERAVFLENPGDLLYNIRDHPDRLEGTFMKTKIATVALAALILLAALFSQSVFCASEGCSSYDDALSVAQGIIKWKKQSTGVSPEEALFSADYSGLAGSSAGDWYAFGIGRLGIDDDYEMYLAALRENVSERYAKDGGLDKIKATEWHRITLAVLALGGDPTSFGRDSEGKPINLIADGVYNRDNLGAQGINGLIWGLIALDGSNYSVPAGSNYTRDGIISELLSLRCPDGGFAFSGERSDPDMTAMAITALAPYYGSEKTYEYELASGEKRAESVRAAVDGALGRLSEMQLETGDFRSYGLRNSGSVCQAIVALCSLGINPFEDVRFIKVGKTLWDGLMTYKNQDGGFAASLSEDGEMPSGSMAGEQALYAMAAFMRLKRGEGRLFDFSSERGRIPVFTERDIEISERVTSEIKTENLADVLRLLYILDFCPDFEGKAEHTERLTATKAELMRIKAEVEDINFAIKNLSDKAGKKAVDEIIRRYKALSDYDKTKIENYDDVLCAYARIKTSERATFIAVGGVFAALIISAVLVARAKKRKRLRLPEDETEDD